MSKVTTARSSSHLAQVIAHLCLQVVGFGINCCEAADAAEEISTKQPAALPLVPTRISVSSWLVTASSYLCRPI